MNKILITGGAGFIGSHLTKRLVEKGHEVIVADTLLRGNKIDAETLERIEFHKADVRDRDKMIEISKGCSIIYHFAAVQGVDVVADNPVETMETEVLGLMNICEAAHQNGIRKIMYASTSGIYGHSALDQMVTENVVVDPKTSYAMAKRYNEIYLASQYQEKGLESVSLRFFNIYGPKQDNRMVIPRFIEQALHHEDITVFGNGKQTRDFTYIDDTIDACLALAEKVQGCEIVNVANENDKEILDLAKLIIELTNSQSKIIFVEAPKKRYDYEVGKRLGSSEKLFAFTGLKPQVGLRDGLLRILQPE